jgi:ribulose-phosphate 3-epimerase
VHELHEHRVRVGVALLQTTPVDRLHHYIKVIDHVLVFSGSLGRHGGTADLTLLDKVRAIKAMRPDIEIGWDGGINEENILTLKDAGVSVFNVGSSIHKSDDPQSTYKRLLELVQS